ncbi:heavy-metal-associated domain-containing protein [Microbacterium sp.]|uniref:heavy-metal-associated domain-containing protein n=1 Tax=Microbacterium sp. TaxID=51671 RepID=UPI0037CB60E8
MEVEGLSWASSKSIVESTLLRQPGVTAVDANPIAQTANVSYDPQRTSQAQLRQWIIECGYHCAGQSVPEHICDPAAPCPTRTFSRTSSVPQRSGKDERTSSSEMGSHTSAYPTHRTDGLRAPCAGRRHKTRISRA